MIFLLDNYDSFTYNLYQMLRMLGQEVSVSRNDKNTAQEVLATAPACLVLSPGPGRPENSGIMQELIATAAAAQVPMFGVCLGMQGLGLHFGGKVGLAHEIMHGKTCKVKHDGQGVFSDLPKDLVVMRYHSLALVEIDTKQFAVTANSADGEVMAMRHRELPVEAVQFHPESFATAHGEQMLRNFITTYVN